MFPEGLLRPWAFAAGARNESLPVACSPSTMSPAPPFPAGWKSFIHLKDAVCPTFTFLHLFIFGWWAAVYGVAQSQTRLKWLSSSRAHHAFMWIQNFKGAGTSLVVQWLKLCTFTAGGTGSIPSQGTVILQASWCSQKLKRKSLCSCALKICTLDYVHIVLNKKCVF